MGIGTTLLFVTSGLLAAIGLSFTGVVINAFRFLTRRNIEADADWLQNFDLERYRGMAELFDRRDFDFLATQPGFTPSLATRLRADRLKIAESYLDRLECDIRIMLNTASRVAVASSDDVNDFSAFLLKQEFSFAVSLVSLRARLKLMNVGLRPRIQFDSLLRNLEPLVVRTHALAAAAA